MLADTYISLCIIS